MMDVEKQIEEITKLAYDIGAYPLAFKEELRTLLSSAQSGEQVPFGYVNTNTGQFFKDVEPCRKNNEGHWRTVYTHPAPALEVDAQGIAQKIRSLPRYSVGKDEKGAMHTFTMQDGPFLRVHEVLSVIDAAISAQAKQGGAA